MTMLRKVILLIYLVVLLFLFKPLATFALNDCPTSCSNSSDCQKRVDCLAGNVNELRGQANTLSSQISVMDNQINLTQARIDSTKQQISDLTLDIDTANKKITNLQSSLDDLVKVLLNRMVITYEVGQIQPLQILATSGNANNFLTRLNYLKIAQAHDKQLIYLTQQAKNDYQNQKNIYEDKKKKIEALKKQLETYTAQLEQNKVDKQQLLADTQGSEANYQTLLAQAQAQLSAFSSFVARQGGASILDNQTVCDDGWNGCYYNQRDRQWGTLALNGTQYTIASDGCLVTVMAMIYSHYGHRGVTPTTINSTPDNFASYYPAYLKYTISADGATSSRQGQSTATSIIDSILPGNPVVVGISYGGPIPDHFIVLISGSGGNYKMNDPFVPNGHNISFTDHYSVSQIVEVDKVVF